MHLENQIFTDTALFKKNISEIKVFLIQIKQINGNKFYLLSFIHIK